MDPRAKRTMAERVRRALSARLADDGWVRTKTSFWTRNAGAHHVEFVHLHLFSFSPEFRIHLGIRVLADPFPAPALNGPDSDSNRTTESLAYSEEASTGETCAARIAEFVRAGESWFARWRSPRALLGDDSPLDTDGRAALRDALDGRPAADSVAASLRLLGLDRA